MATAESFRSIGSRRSLGFRKPVPRNVPKELVFAERVAAHRSYHYFAKNGKGSLVIPPKNSALKHPATVH